LDASDKESQAELSTIISYVFLRMK
jgi:hypothetical protein